MKNIILLILFLVGIFILNITFYYSSDSYRNFLKKAKQGIENTEKDENLSSHKNSNYFSWIVEDKKEELDKKEEKPEKDHEVKQEVKLWKWYQDILNMFSGYNLSKLDVNANLFDLTNEYPDEYYEFYSPKFTLYFFTSKTYNQVYDIFSILQSELPFKVNPTNTFWDKSFFINFNKDVNDETIRIVVLKDWIVFWLKVKSDEYNNIKQILQNLRNN